MMLGRHWRGSRVNGWLVTEKFRGVHAYWDGQDAWTRGGVRIALPAEYRAALPAGHHLEFEVWAGRGPENGPEEQEATRAAVHGRFTPRIRFLVFDAPAARGDWSQRMYVASALISGAELVRPVGFEQLGGFPALEQAWERVRARGGEGLMLRAPNDEGYLAGRTDTLLKVKLPPSLRRGRLHARWGASSLAAA